MYRELTMALAHSARGKVGMYEKSKLAYATASALAGMYIGFGVLTMGLSGAVLGQMSLPVYKLFNGFIFSMALSLVMMAGADLFTGNTLVLSTGAFEKSISNKKAVVVCVFSYFGNLIGSFVLSYLFIGSGLANGKMGSAILELAIAKAHYGSSEIFFKGILCNILVCLAVLCCYKLKSESAKLIMIFWCIMPFISLGFEHSIANMTTFIIALNISSEITFAMALHNLLPATLGNIVGGLLVSTAYFTMGKNERNSTEKL